MVHIDAFGPRTMTLFGQHNAEHNELLGAAMNFFEVPKPVTNGTVRCWNLAVVVGVAKGKASRFACAFFALLCFASTIYAQQSVPLQFVSEFVREMDALESIRSMADKELKEKGANLFAVGIGSSTRVQLELNTSIGILKSFQLPGKFSDLPKNLASLYQEKIELHERLIAIATEFTSTKPKSDIDYGAFTAEMPKVRARLEYIDKTVFNATNLIFLSLIDMEPDSQGHVSHLTITKAERQQLVSRINNQFGSKLTAKQSVSPYADCAWLLKTQLLKFKGSDEPR
jgi:hypothetical protein